MAESIEVLYLPDTGEYWVGAEGGLIDQTALSVCFNARGAMPRGGVLTVETRLHTATRESLVRRPRVAPGEFVQLRFSDTGRGACPGLASVRAGVARHGGWIEAQNKPGQGRTLSVFLPRVIEETTSGGVAVYEVTANKDKNYLLIVAKGYLKAPEIAKAVDEVVDACRNLKPGFVAVTDLTTFRPTDEEGTKELARLQRALVEAGMKGTIRVSPNPITLMQVNRTRREEGMKYETVEVGSLAEALALVGEAS
jgi:hypothetical protein